MESSLLYIIIATLTLVTIVILILCIVIYYALDARRQGFDVIKRQIDYFSLVTFIDDKNVTFTPHGDDSKQYSIPILGIEGKNGHIVSEGGPVRHDIGITRSISSLNGDIRKGSRVRTDLFVYESDPETSLGLDYEEIKFDSELGELDAWVVPQKSDNWAIFIHGHRSNRRESLRLTSLFHRLGYNQMLITYRNDEGAPVDKGGYHMFGITEWKDLESAVRYSLNRGAKNINLVGHSMGGAIVLKFLLESRLSDQISKIILESPALDLNRIISAKAANLPFPASTFLLPVKKMVSRIVGFNWSELNYLENTNKYNVPILLIHSETDDTVPVILSDEFAISRPDIIEYVRLHNAPHAAAWNFHRNKIEKSIESFLVRSHQKS